MISNNMFSGINLAAPGVVGDLDMLCRTDSDFKNLSIEDILKKCPEDMCIAYVLVGIWAFHFLDIPRKEKGQVQVYGYEYIENNKLRVITDGLLGVIRYSHIEIPEDHDAIDYAYKSCIKLYHLLGDKAEDELVKQVISNPTVSLIDSLGVLVGHEVKGSITKDTFLLLKNIAESGQEPFATAASRVLIEDVDRMNAINHFL